ncbi:hypothetical protein [Nostoc sp.]|uniref:hypothetical protein n=1 Tax=Nostoc sp. TaxID=1180 RepID=UPI002FF4A158
MGCFSQKSGNKLSEYLPDNEEAEPLYIKSLILKCKRGRQKEKYERWLAALAQPAYRRH